MTRCVHCAKNIPKADKICPFCHGEQPVGWMVNLAYVMAFLFAQGVVYRLLWPNAQSGTAYTVYFVITVIGAVGVVWLWRKLRRAPQSPLSREPDK